MFIFYFLHARNAGEAKSDFVCFIMFACVGVCLIDFLIQLQLYFIFVLLTFLYGNNSMR